MRTAVLLLAVLPLAVLPQVTYSADPVMTPPQPPGPIANTKTDPDVEKHLAAWEKAVGGVNSIRLDIALTRTDAVFKRESKYTGALTALRPNLLVLRLDNADDKTKTDYEAYICDGKAMYVYSGTQKTITEHPLPLKWPLSALANDPVFGLLTGVKAKDAAQRFEMGIYKTDANYVYLDIKPRNNTDKRDFAHVRLALYGPDTKFAYLPAQVYILKPGGDSEVWKFTDLKVDDPAVKPENFKFVSIEGWSGLKIPPAQP
jgi:TIGR03009 family protein